MHEAYTSGTYPCTEHTHKEHVSMLMPIAPPNFKYLFNVLTSKSPTQEGFMKIRAIENLTLGHL